MRSQSPTRAGDERGDHGCAAAEAVLQEQSDGDVVGLRAAVGFGEHYRGRGAQVQAGHDDQGEGDRAGQVPLGRLELLGQVRHRFPAGEGKEQDDDATGDGLPPVGGERVQAAVSIVGRAATMVTSRIRATPAARTSCSRPPILRPARFAPVAATRMTVAMA